MSKKQTAEEREKNWTAEQYVAYLRLAWSNKEGIVIDVVSCLMRLEKKPHLWQQWGLESFGEALNSPRYIGIGLSSLQYNNIKKAIEDLGEAEVRRIGLPAARRARKLHGEDRERLLLRADEFVSQYNRPLSAQAVSNLYREIDPPVPGAGKGKPSKMQRLEEENVRLKAQVQYGGAVIKGVMARVKAWHAANGVRGCPLDRILREAREAARAGK